RRPVELRRAAGGSEADPRQQGLPPGVRGVGEYDEASGLWDSYEGLGEAGGPSWTDILEAWDLVECDLHSHYGIDTASGVLDERSWEWLRRRITGLLSADTRLYRHVKPPEKPPPVPRSNYR
ncbi:MAG: hypothetical protein ACRD0P_28095, partial [Stackebrandtia sp.]